MDFIQWSSDWGDIDDFFNGVPSTRSTSPSRRVGGKQEENIRVATPDNHNRKPRRDQEVTRERCHFKKRCDQLRRGPNKCNYFHTEEEIAHYHPNYYYDNADANADVREEVHNGNNVLHIINVSGSANDQQLSKFLKGKFKMAFKHDLNLLRCRVRQNFNDAIIECENEDDCSLLMALKSRTFKDHEIEIDRLPSSIHDDFDHTINTINTSNTTDTGISIDENQAIEFEDTTSSQNTTEILNSPDTKTADNSEDKSAMLLKDEETQTLHNEDTPSSQNTTEIVNSPDTKTVVNSEDKSAMLLRDEDIQKLQNENTPSSQNTTEIEPSPDITTDISNGKHEIQLRDDEENQKQQNEDMMVCRKTDAENSCDIATATANSNGKHEVMLGDEETQSQHHEDTTNRKTSIDNTPDTTTEMVLNDKHAIILREYETLKLQHEAVTKQNLELSSESEDLKVKHEDTLSKYTKLKKLLSHSKVDQAKIVSLKRQIAESDQRFNKLTDTLSKQTGTICDVMEEKRIVANRLEKLERAFDETESELRKQLDVRLESELSKRQEAERVFDREKSELRKQLENAQRFSDRGLSELRKQFQDEKRNIVKRLENEASLRQEAEQQLQDKDQKFGKERSHHEQERSKLEKQLQDEIRGHRDEKQAFLQKESSFRKQLDDEIEKRQEAEQIFHNEKSILRQELDAEISRRQKAEKLFHQQKSELHNKLDSEISKRQEEEERNDQLMTTYSQLKKERGKVPTSSCSTGVKEEEIS